MRAPKRLFVLLLCVLALTDVLHEKDGQASQIEEVREASHSVIIYKRECPFLAVNALEAQAKVTHDPGPLRECEAPPERLQRKQPIHPRTAMAGLDSFRVLRDRALALVALAHEEPDEGKKADLLDQGQRVFEAAWDPFKVMIAQLTEWVDELYESELNGELDEAGLRRRGALEFQRELSEFLLAEAYQSYALTFEDDSAEREAALREALSLYDAFVFERGCSPRMLYYAYLGKADTTLELGEYEEAIRQFEDMTCADVPFVPDDPKAKRELEELVQEVLLRAHYGLLRALNESGNSERAYLASLRIEENATSQGWEHHPLGILLNFERAKALDGAGREGPGQDTEFARWTCSGHR